MCIGQRIGSLIFMRDAHHEIERELSRCFFYCYIGMSYASIIVHILLNVRHYLIMPLSVLYSRFLR